jgi:thiamine biosynthesis protein ThiS
MRITANGRVDDAPDGTTVAQFVRQRGLDVGSVVVELNGEALERSRYEEVELADGDRLELVRPVAGG